MKYFKKELWAAFNSEDDEEYFRAEEEWARNVEEYRIQLDGLLPRLSANAARFFSKVSLHDGTLLSFAVGDALGSTSKLPRMKRQTRVQMTVVSGNNGATYTLNYSGIFRCSVDFPGSPTVFYEKGDPFGDWGYDELTDAGDGLFQHDILFECGATVSIVFTKFRYQRSRRQQRQPT